MSLKNQKEQRGILTISATLGIWWTASGALNTIVGFVLLRVNGSSTFLPLFAFTSSWKFCTDYKYVKYEINTSN